MQRIRKLAAAALFALAATSCTDAAGPGLTAPEGAEPRFAYVVSVSVCCSTTLYQGGSYTVNATVYDSDGNVVANPTVQWWVGNNAVASINGISGGALVTATGVGQTAIYASVNGVVGSTTLWVVAPPAVSTVQFTQSQLHLQMGSPGALSAQAYDQYGNPLNGVSFSWSIANTGVATVSSGGLVTPVAPGTTTLTATAGGKSATAQVTVIPQITLSFSGPSSIWSSGTYQWDVQASGGTGSFTYQWYVDYAYGSYSQPLSSSNAAFLQVDENTGPFLMRVVVTSGGVVSEAGTMVCNFIAGANC